MKKAILLDIDGTLVNTKRLLTPKTKEALLACERQGMLLVLASGRPTSGLLHLAKELKMNEYGGLLVSFNGAMVIDAKTKEVLFEKVIALEVCQAVLEHLKQFRVYPMIDRDEYMFVNHVYGCEVDVHGTRKNIVQYEAKGNDYLLCEIEDLAKFCTFPLHKILTAGDPDYLKEHAAQMEEPFKERLNCSFTAPFYFEFMPKNVNKKEAIEFVLEDFHISKEDIIAFGDAQNDQEMIEMAGLGIAMGNAAPSLKEKADFVTKSNDEDGIAYALSVLGIIDRS